MLFGEYRQLLDAKGRVFIPTKLREALGERFMLSRGLDKCVCVYPMDEWDNFVAKLESLPIARERMVRRYFYSGAIDTSTDSQGRVTLSAAYREFAGLNKDIVIIGNKTHLEIWDAAVWDEMQSGMTNESIIAELLTVDF